MIESRVSSSSISKLMLLLLALLYGLGTFAAFVVAVNTTDSTLRAKLFTHGFFHAVVMSTCTIALILSINKRKAADVFAAISAVITAVVAFRALVSGIVTGFHIYHLIEPLVVFPSVLFILWKLTRASSRRVDVSPDGQEMRENEEKT